MTTTKALVIVEKGQVAIKELPLPELREGHIFVKVRAVGINPTDWKSIDGGDPGRFGSRSGCDYAGEVVEVGPGVTKNLKKGDRVAGWVFGANWDTPDNGAFGEYLVAKEHVLLKVPDNVTDEEAATLGVSVTTVGQGLYKTLKLPLPNNPAKTPFPVLIYGGSTATGIYGIKYAKASGLTVIATASPRNFELLKSAGADHVFDYKSPTVGADIRALTANKLMYAWDCTGYGGAICAAALSDGEGEGGSKPTYATIIPVEREVFDKANPVVDGPHFTLGYDAFGVAYPRFGTTYEPDPEEIEFARMFWNLTQELLASGALKPLRPEVNRLGSGLEGVVRGLDELRNDRVSGTKLVYTL
ncbi:GroES-like protein [Xylariaceae sp. FL1651]|nr:GroES-like protein [Xylariaceae sp. FL1651]